MSHKKYLSEKKENLSISIPIALNEWISRYVSKNQKLDPADDRLKNKSSFICFLLEKCMELITSGKSLNDIEKAPDNKFVEFYDKITFKAVIPVFNIGIALNKYSDKNIKFSLSMLEGFRVWVLKDIDMRDFESIKLFMVRLKKFLLSNNITKELKVDLFTEKGSKYFKATIEYIGLYEHLHFEMCKQMAGIMGFLGLNLKEFLFTKHDLYARFDFVETDLFSLKEFARKERTKLIEQNLELIINYYHIINDDDNYLWMKMAEQKELYINFFNNGIFNKWFAIIVEDFEKHGLKKEFLLNILKFFEKIHWISIEDKTNLIFKMNAFLGKKEEEIILKSLEKYAKVEKADNLYTIVNPLLQG